MKGWREIVFIGLFGFLGFIELMEQGPVENCPLFAKSNSINTTNT